MADLLPRLAETINDVHTHFLNVIAPGGSHLTSDYAVRLNAAKTLIKGISKADNESALEAIEEVTQDFFKDDSGRDLIARILVSGLCDSLRISLESQKIQNKASEKLGGAVINPDK